MIKLSLFFAFMLFSAASPALACSCIRAEPPSEALKSADAVFSGTVIYVSWVENYQKKVTFVVDKTWKGANSATITISTPSDEGICGNAYMLGQSWIVYAQGESNLVSVTCSRTRLIQNAKEDLGYLGEGETAPLHLSTGAWIALLLLASAAATCIILKLKRNRAAR